MKKNLFYYLFAVICSVSLFTSCSDDDDEKVVCPVGETTFTDKSGLQLMYLANLHTSFLCNLIYPTFSRILLYSC